MSSENGRRIALVGLLGLLPSACMSAANPWVMHDVGADLKQAASDPARMCDVVLSNATERTVEAYLALPGQARSLGLLSAGQSLEFGVACSSRQVYAEAVSHEIGMAEGQRFRKGAVLDVRKQTHVRITPADEIRW